MVVEWLGRYFEDLEPDEILTVEYIVREGLPEIPIITAIAEDFIEVRMDSPWDCFRVLDAKGKEIPL